MALFGTVKFYRYEDDLDNPIVNELCYGENLPEDSPNYDKRGTCEEVTSYPKLEILDRQEDDVYVIIKMCALHLEDFPQHETVSPKHWNVVYRVNIYATEDDRVQDINQPMMETDSNFIHVADISDEQLNNTNLIAYCYEHLKTQKGFDELQNV